LERAETEHKNYDATIPPSFEDYVRSLGENERNAMHRNLNRIRETAEQYPIEVVRDRRRILELSGQLYEAYDAQYSGYDLRWLHATAEYFRDIADVPNTEILVCWHMEEGQRQFAGFVLNLDQQFNHRMGILPDYRHRPGSSDDDHLIYFRLTLRNIEETLKSGYAAMWIAQTTYEAKRRLGFVPYPLVNYRRAIFGFRGLTNFLYHKFMDRIADPQVLYRF
jgi:hypothetical protein